jgi:general secretion pathway protein J
VRARGFTLVELMIAMAITATIGVMTIGSFTQIDRAATAAREQEGRYAAGRLALSRLSREISMAFLSSNYDTARFRDPVTLFVGREDELLFTTMAHERRYLDAKESDQAVVEYVLDSDPEHSGERALFRREKVRLDDEPDRGGRKDLVADHVASLRLAYWDPKRREWAREWTTRTAAFASDRTLPSRVRIEVEIVLADGRREKLVTESRIALTTPLEF